LPVGDPQGLMLQYLDYLKQQFNISASTGYSKVHTISSYEKAISDIDYRKDKDGELGSDNITTGDVFPEGFRFP
jgi:hypothetical protein